MKKGIILLSMMMTFLFLVVIGIQPVKAANATAGDRLSHTEDYTWYKKSRGVSETTQYGEKRPWRMATWEQRVNHFIEAVQNGDRKAFLFVEYNLLDGYAQSKGYPRMASLGNLSGKLGRKSLGVLWKLYNDAQEKKTTIVKILTKDNAKIRKNVIRATLVGLFNKDPRVRLIATNLLRRLRPDAMMARDVKKALILETVTTERSKWRDKDIDIPSIENPRLGWGAVSWSRGAYNADGSARVNSEQFKNRFYDGSDHGSNGLLQGYGDNKYGGGSSLRGEYLVKGLYRGEERNDYPITIEEIDYSLPRGHSINTSASSKKKVWTKASLLRYGADEHISGFETVYGFSEREYMPRFAYAYIDYRDPDSGMLGETIYTGYHSVWEEMKKLDLFVTRAIWIGRIKSGDINALRVISKDTFRTLADQIDGESLTYVPMKSPKFKIFGEREFRQIIVGMLENRVVSTREECVRFLRRLFDFSRNKAIRKEIKKALREARRRELVIDTIRGRHLHEQLIAPKTRDEWWGGNDEVDTSQWALKDRSKYLQIYRHQVEYPEETDIIYHDRRKPGQEEADDAGLDDDAAAGDDAAGDDDAGLDDDAAGDDDAAVGDDDAAAGDDDDASVDGGTGTTETDSGSTKTGGLTEEEAKKRREDIIKRAHPFIRKILTEGKSQASFTDLEDYLRMAEQRKDVREGGVKKEGTTKEGTTEEGTTKEGTTEEGTTEEGTDEEGTDEEGLDDDDTGADDAGGDLEAGEEDLLKPGQSPGVKQTEYLKAIDKAHANDPHSVTARSYQITRGVETLIDLFAGNGKNLLQATSGDLQTAILIWLHKITETGATLNDYTFIEYMLAGANAVPAGAGGSIRSYGTLKSELGPMVNSDGGSYHVTRRRFALHILDKVIWPKTQDLVKQFSINKSVPLGEAKTFSDIRNEIYQTLPEDPKPDKPGKSDLYGTDVRADPHTGKTASQRDQAQRSHGKYYGHGRGGYYRYYDKRFKLDQAENDGEKLSLRFYHYPSQWRQKRSQIIKGILVALTDRDPIKRLILIHMLRRLIPDPSMHSTVLKLLREVETVDKRPYLYVDSIGKVQEKIVVHELLKLQRFILRRILVNKIRTGEDPDMLKKIPKGGFLPLVIRIDAEWDPFRIPLRTPIPYAKGNGMFFTKENIGVIAGGLDNRNFLVQREVARWIVTFYNENRGGHIGDPDGDSAGAKFLSAMKKAEAKDVIYYERNYTNWEYVLGYMSPGVLAAYNKAVGEFKKALRALETKNDAPYTAASDAFKKAVEEFNKLVADYKKQSISYKNVNAALTKAGQAIDAKSLDQLKTAEVDLKAALKFVAKSTEYSDGKVPTYTPDQNITTPVGRIPVKINSWADRDIFRKIDWDRKKEFVTDYGRGKDADKTEFESIGTYQGEANVRKSYSTIKKEREEKMKKLKTEWDRKEYNRKPK